MALHCELANTSFPYVYWGILVPKQIPFFLSHPTQQPRGSCSQIPQLVRGILGNTFDLYVEKLVTVAGEHWEFRGLALF